MYSLREIFQLRASPSLGVRRCVCRLFDYSGRFGFFDASGLVWPVSIQGSEAKLSPFDVIEIQVGAVFVGDVLSPSGVKLLTPARSENFFADSGSPRLLPNQVKKWIDQVAERGTFSESSGATLFSSATAFPEFEQHQVFHQVKRKISEHFRNLGYLELEAPLLVKSGGIERYLNPFVSSYIDHQGLSHTLQLPTSPEFALKKLIAKGHHRVFSMAQTFRNHGESSKWHSPQFCMLEWYTVGQGLMELIEQTLEIVRVTARALNHGRPADAEHLTPVHYRVEFLYRKYFDLDLVACMKDSQMFYQALSNRSQSVLATDSWETLFWKSFLDVIEPQILRENFVILSGFPARFASLAACEPNGQFAERFEMFLQGVEICNGYFELTDSSEMKQRFEEICASRPEMQRDEEFEDSMFFGLPPCSGNALGLERLISLLLGSQNLKTGHGIGPFPLKTHRFPEDP